MSPSSRSGRAALVVAFIAVVAFFAGCTPTTNEGGGVVVPSPVETGTPEPEPDPDPTNGGAEDPDQERVRTGPTVDYGGPAYGDQGETELIADGVWCERVALFWGGSAPIPDGVVMEFTEALIEPALVEVTANPCGTDFGTGAALPSCIGLKLEANASAFCGLEILPGPDFLEGTIITFAGTMTCPSAEACDAVEARDAEKGPQIIVNTPVGA
jgi:hypothetical protein